MKKLSILTLCLFIHSAHSELINTPRSFWGKISGKLSLEQNLSLKNENGRYVLHGSEENKKQAIKDLAKWSEKRANGDVDMREPIVVDDLIADSVLKNQWTRHLLNGPNCHNNSLITMGIMSKRMYVGPEEIDKHLELFCKPIHSPQIGSIGVQRTSGGLSLHSYVVVGENLIYQKANVRGNSGPVFSTFPEKWKQNDLFFQCEKTDITRTCSEHVRELSEEVENLHQRTANMVKSLRNATNYKAYIQEAHELDAKIFLDGSCPQHQELLQTRIQSMLGLYTELEMTGGIYGKGTYDTYGPRI